MNTLTVTGAESAIEELRGEGREGKRGERERSVSESAHMGHSMNAYCTPNLETRGTIDTQTTTVCSPAEQVVSSSPPLPHPPHPHAQRDNQAGPGHHSSGAVLYPPLWSHQHWPPRRRKARESGSPSEEAPHKENKICSEKARSVLGNRPAMHTRHTDHEWCVSELPCSPRKPANESCRIGFVRIKVSDRIQPGQASTPHSRRSARLA